MALLNGAPRTGGTFFSAKDYASSAALLVEVTKEGQAKKFKSEELEPAAIATITVFRTPSELEAGVPGEVLEDAIVQGALGKKFLASRNRAGEYDELAGKLEKVTLNNGNSMWNLTPLGEENVSKIVAYMEKRNEDIPDWAA